MFRLNFIYFIYYESESKMLIGNYLSCVMRLKMWISLGFVKVIIKVDFKYGDNE